MLRPMSVPSPAFGPVELKSPGGARAARSLLLLVTMLLGAVAGAAEHRPGELLVKFHAEGPHALLDCAESRERHGEALRDATADASDSLDRLNARVGAHQVRALFRRPDGRSFDSQRRQLRQRFEASRARRVRRSSAEIPELAHIYRLRLRAGQSVEAAAEEFRADPHVAWAQPNFLVEADFVPNDPFFHSSESWGQPYRDLWGLELIRAPEAWDLSEGEGIVVAVVDTGIDYTHPDLAANVWVNPGEDLDGNGVADPSDFNGIDDDDNGYIDDLNGFDFANSVDSNGDGDFDDPRDVSDSDPFDDNGHGTHVSGMLRRWVTTGSA